MIETIHIFDEYSQSPNDLTAEQRNKKRLALETLIYDILKQTYGKQFQDFWKSHEVPTHTNKSIVIIERRIHPNLAFLLYNAAYFCRDWGITILCSDWNYEYCKEICGHNADRVTLYPLFRGNPDADVAKEEYNNLLRSADFYRSFQAEHLLILQTDCYLRRKIPDEIFLYDYVAAPYEWDKTMAGGGLSFRKRSAMIQICEKMPQETMAEDVFICRGIHALGFRMPKFAKGTEFVTESVFSEDPFGIHQWWTFFFPNEIPDAETIFHTMMTLHI